MITLLTIVISVLIISWWIRIANKYAYSDLDRVKIKVPNIIKNITLCCMFNNIVIAITLVTAISFIEFEWEGWEEDKLLYWLFKK